MTEAEWLAADKPYDLTHHKTSRDDRKRRLLVCACVRRGLGALTDDRFAAATVAAEEFADGAVAWADLVAARKAARAAEADLKARGGRESLLDTARAVLAVTEREFMLFKMALEYMQYARGTRDRSKWDAAIASESRAQCDLARDVFGNPFRTVAFAPSWRTSTAVGLARAMYESRDFGPMPVLADALEEAGCDSAGVLTHCRGPGPHVRGCWVADLVSGKTSVAPQSPRPAKAKGTTAAGRKQTGR